MSEALYRWIGPTQEVAGVPTLTETVGENGVPIDRPLERMADQPSERMADQPSEEHPKR